MTTKRRADYQRQFGIDPLDAGIVGEIADFECKHGRLPRDGTPECGCFGPIKVVAVTRRVRSVVKKGKR